MNHNVKKVTTVSLAIELTLDEAEIIWNILGNANSACGDPTDKLFHDFDLAVYEMRRSA